MKTKTKIKTKSKSEWKPAPSINHICGTDSMEEWRKRKIGRNDESDNACIIKRYYHYNGGCKDDFVFSDGTKPFGGSDMWPVLTLELSFQEGEEAQRDALTEKLKKFIDKEMP